MLNVSHDMVCSQHLTTFQVNVGSYMRTKNPLGVIWENVEEEKAHLSCFNVQLGICIS